MAENIFWFWLGWTLGGVVAIVLYRRTVRR